MLRITLDEAIAYEEEIVERARSAMNFESVDSQVTPVSVEGIDWDGKIYSTYSDDEPIPVNPEPPKPRQED